MVDFKRGIKAGVAAAAIYLIVSVGLASIGQTFWFPLDLISAAGLRIQLEFVDPFVLVSLIAHRIVGGIIFGASFAALYNHLPSAASVKKGVIFSAFLWILYAVEFIYQAAGWPTGAGVQTSSGLAGVTICLSSLGLASVSIIFALLFGALVGAMWGNFREKEMIEVRKGTAAMLVGLIVGGLIWLGGAVWLLIIVLIEGTPILEILGEHGSFWWYGVLYLSAVFLGLPGWILGLIAWRKMRKGKPGLKSGVAGGVCMALTGHMLFPGVLMIIGGVLSRREPAINPSTIKIG